MLSKFKIDPKVSNAINDGKAVVALESTLISHGLPYPENIKVANDSIKAVEESGLLLLQLVLSKVKLK